MNSSLLAARDMGRKIVEQKPLGLVACYSGNAIVLLSDDGLVGFYKRQGNSQEATRWEARSAADRQWAQSVKDAMPLKDLERLAAAGSMDEYVQLEKRTVEAALSRRPP